MKTCIPISWFLFSKKATVNILPCINILESNWVGQVPFQFTLMNCVCCEENISVRRTEMEARHRPQHFCLYLSHTHAPPLLSCTRRHQLLLAQESKNLEREVLVSEPLEDS